MPTETVTPDDMDVYPLVHAERVIVGNPGIGKTTIKSHNTEYKKVSLIQTYTRQTRKIKHLMSMVIDASYNNPRYNTKTNYFSET